jgi:hypothetical protein
MTSTGTIYTPTLIVNGTTASGLLNRGFNRSGVSVEI